MIEEMIGSVKKMGAFILSAHRGEYSEHFKSSRRDIQTEYDVAVQKALIEDFRTLVPDAVFIGEENNNYDAFSDRPCFIIDPIDGTANFAKEYNHSCISAAFAENGKITKAVVYDPYLDELFSAELGKGAFLNGRRISVEDVKLEDSLVGFGTCPYDLSLTDETFAFAAEVFRHSNDLRRSGASALDICYSACGKLNLFYELILFPWDYAAGSLIVTEAGGTITDIDGDPLSFSKRCGVVSGNPRAHRDFLKLRRSFKKE